MIYLRIKQHHYSWMMHINICHFNQYCNISTWDDILPYCIILIFSQKLQPAGGGKAMKNQHFEELFLLCHEKLWIPAVVNLLNTQYCLWITGKWNVISAMNTYTRLIYYYVTTNKGWFSFKLCHFTLFGWSGCLEVCAVLCSWLYVYYRFQKVLF